MNSSSVEMIRIGWTISSKILCCASNNIDSTVFDTIQLCEEVFILSVNFLLALPRDRFEQKICWWRVIKIIKNRILFQTLMTFGHIWIMLHLNCSWHLKNERTDNKIYFIKQSDLLWTAAFFFWHIFRLLLFLHKVSLLYNHIW